MIVIIATPLNSIMENQVMELKHDSLSACYMSYDGTCGATFDEEDSDDEFTDGMNSDVIFYVILHNFLLKTLLKSEKRVSV